MLRAEHCSGHEFPWLFHGTVDIRRGHGNQVLQARVCVENFVLVLLEASTRIRIVLSTLIDYRVLQLYVIRLKYI